MQVKKSLLTLAVSCGLMALPALAQSSSSPTPADQQTPAAAASAPSSTPSAAQDSSAPASTPTAAPSGSMSGQDSSAAQSGAASSSDSSTVQSNVQSALQKDSQLAGNTVSVDVNSKNQIVLSGTVSSQSLKDEAEKVATQTAGSGYTVKNHIRVGSAGAGSMNDQQPK